MFNGKNLDGWIPKSAKHECGDNYANTFRVENGVIKVSYDGYGPFDGQFGHLFYKEPFTNYRLRVEYRFVGDQAEGGAGWAFRNSGIMIHGQTPQSMGKIRASRCPLKCSCWAPGSGERTTGTLHTRHARRD